MLVYFLRHASAGQGRRNPALDDKRPLDKEGIGQCRDVGRLLSALGVHFDLIISSPLKRATQTASLVGNRLGYDSDLVLDAALSPGASYEDFRELLRRHGKLAAVMVVGHNPSISRFLSLLVTKGAFNQAVEMKKGSVARVDHDSRQTVLNWLLTPKIARSGDAPAHSDSKAASSRPKTARK
jgi:phosphohistidine phosphatase